MLYLPSSNSAFLHIPKCGGNWVRAAIAAAGVESEEHGVMIADLEFGQGCHRTDENTRYFTFVRHPIAWYRSYWADRQLNGWGGDLIIAHKCKSNRFAGFVRRVTEQYPAYLSSLFERYVGAGNPAVLVGRTESLADDLISFLGEVGEHIKESGIRRLPPLNLGSAFPKFRELTTCNPQTLQSILDSESKAFDLFGYARKIPPYVEPEKY